ncbi:methyltransferase [Marmoricola endophyticus]|uniref:Methyltransferase n=1 Tax=Marmoricola endophyticus TaxID=2040280 RepID=A0A917BBN2_9ACTN|nr:class I SAM-dependent methyltransferase [Marmoricola endophyticus]GGF36222.1 methyltransferase [Marmoricola endophyticus]
MSAPEEWAGDRVSRWLAQASELERQLAPVSQVLLEATALQPGEQVLDVGCGTGPTTRQAAAAVGTTGAVTGIDVAAEMLEAAAQAPPTEGAAPVEWTCADVVTWQGPSAAYDVVLSRFGVMFFADPAAAMRTLADVTRPGGRLAFAVWGPRSSSALFEAPYQAARSALAAEGYDVPSESPADAGSYSWSDEEYVVPLLAGAGWRDVAVAPRELVLPVAGGDPEAASRAALDFGPTRVLLDGRSQRERDLVQGAVREVFAGAVDAEGRAHLPASVRLVTARR